MGLEHDGEIGPYRGWPRSSRILLLVCAAAVILTAIAAVSSVKLSHRYHYDEGLHTLEQFLDAATSGASSWQEFAAPKFIDEFRDTTPLWGVPEAADALELDISYSVESVTPSSTSGVNNAHYLEAVVEFTYEYGVAESRISTTFYETFWVARPFYYQEHDDSFQPSHYGTLEGIGPWKVVDFSSVADTDHRSIETSAQSASDPSLISQLSGCSSSHVVLKNLSNEVRQSGQFTPTCITTKNMNTIASAQVQKVFAEEMPYILDRSVYEDTTELPRWERITDITATSKNRTEVSVLTQYRATINKQNYVVTTALWETHPEFIYTLVSVVVVK